MDYRDIAYQCATSKSRPIEGVGMNDVKFVAALSQLQEKFKEEIRLGKKAIIGGPLLRGTIEIRGRDTFRHRDGNDGDPRDEGIVPCKQSHAMTSFYQPLCEVCQQRLRSTQIGLCDSRNQWRDQCNSHISPR